MKRVYVVGPSSTGKTTLVNALAAKLALGETAVVKEVARNVMDKQGYSRSDVGSLEMQQAIMTAHLKKEYEGRTCPIQICDRSAVDPIVYAILTARDIAEARERQRIMLDLTQFQYALETYRRSIFLLLAPVAEWQVDDGVRLVEHQSQCYEEFKRLLRGLGIEFREIGPEMRLLEERIMFTLGLMKL